MKQGHMTGVKLTSGAASAKCTEWNAINWRAIESEVNRLQMRIAQAKRANRMGKVRSLQWLLTHSRAAKLLAVRRVTTNGGKRTAGVDGQTLTSANQKMTCVESLKRRGYQALPLRRVYIPKKNGKERPLGIPTMIDRAQQALHLFALEPVAEATADPNSYGFRPHRSCHDAIEQCFNVLVKRGSARWILEGDIRACFDCIDHNWLLEHIPLDRIMLTQWLKAGYLEKQVLYPTDAGTPQGGIISPLLANMALDGLEAMVKALAPKDARVHMVRYADDFIITGLTESLLAEVIQPKVSQFLRDRGLTLSDTKTRITHIETGFDFLGFNIRKYKGKMLIKPAKANVKAFLCKIRGLIRSSKSIKTETLIKQLNPKIMGWAYYYRHEVSKRTFGYIDRAIFDALSRWMKRRHPKKSWAWCRKKYFQSRGFRNWIFAVKSTTPNSLNEYVELMLMSSVPIVRHIKIQAKASKYDPVYAEYFEKRKALKRNAGQKHWVNTLKGTSDLASLSRFAG